MKKKPIYLSSPHMSDMKDLLTEAFDSNWIAPLGPFYRFEDEMAEFLKGIHTCALSSGTATSFSLKILGIKQGDIVLCPSLLLRQLLIRFFRKSPPRYF